MDDFRRCQGEEKAAEVGVLSFLDLSRQGLKPVLTGSGALYLMLALSQAAFEPGFRSLPAIALAVITAGVLFGFRLLLARYSPSPKWVETFGVAFAFLVLLNGALHVYLLSTFQEAVGSALLALGLTCFFLPCRTLVTVLAVSLVMWMAVGWFAEITPSWLNFAFGLFVATGLKPHAEFQKTRMKTALSSAQSELHRRQEAERAWRESEERYSLAAVGSKDGLWDWNIEQDRVYYSPRWKSMLGFDEQEIGESLTDWFGLVHPEDLDGLQDSFSNHLEGKSRNLETECRLLCRDGNYLWVLVRGTAVRGEDGRATRMAGSQTDIHQRKLAERALYEGAFLDSLTGLGNRTLFTEHLQMALARAQRQADYDFSVIFMDLDRFKMINDSMGHLAGDQLLQEFARFLEGTLRQVDTVSRFGGDEFAVLLDAAGGRNEAERCADRILEALKQPFEIGGHEVFVGVSIGIVPSRRGYEKPEEILRDADTAMYRAKLEGNSCSRVFRKKMHIEAYNSWQLDTDLRKALRDRQFRMWYQPIIDIKDNRVAGCEALIRWQHPRKGLLAPGRFLKAAEEAGMLAAVGWWAVEEACRTCRLWQDHFPSQDPISVSVNIAGTQLVRGEAVEKVQSILEQTQLDPNSLKLEILEDSVREIATAAAILNDLCELGVQLHLDDFGTGYSSLSYLHQLPLAVSKIDRSFISEMDRSRGNQQVVRAMVNLIHDLGMEVTVEGVETENQLAFVESLGCEYAQGFYFSKPLAPEFLWALFQSLNDFRFQLEATG